MGVVLGAGNTVHPPPQGSNFIAHPPPNLRESIAPLWWPSPPPGCLLPGTSRSIQDASGVLHSSRMLSVPLHWTTSSVSMRQVAFTKAASLSSASVAIWHVFRHTQELGLLLSCLCIVQRSSGQLQASRRRGKYCYPVCLSFGTKYPKIPHLRGECRPVNPRYPANMNLPLFYLLEPLPHWTSQLNLFSVQAWMTPPCWLRSSHIQGVFPFLFHKFIKHKLNCICDLVRPSHGTVLSVRGQNPPHDVGEGLLITSVFRRPTLLALMIVALRSDHIIKVLVYSEGFFSGHSKHTSCMLQISYRSSVFPIMSVTSSQTHFSLRFLANKESPTIPCTSSWKPITPS